MKKHTILVVDDSETDRYLLKRTIEKSELIEKVYEAENGRSALDLLVGSLTKTSENSMPIPIIIFVDVNMPLLNGLEFLEKYSKIRRNNPLLNFCNIIMFSSSENNEDKSSAMSHEFVYDYFLKGALGPKNLREKINNIIIELNT